MLGRHPFDIVALYKLRIDGFHHFKKVILKDNKDILLQYNIDVDSNLDLEKEFQINNHMDLCIRLTQADRITKEKAEKAWKFIPKT